MRTKKIPTPSFKRNGRRFLYCLRYTAHIWLWFGLQIFTLKVYKIHLHNMPTLIIKGHVFEKWVWHTTKCTLVQIFKMATFSAIPQQARFDPSFAFLFYIYSPPSNYASINTCRGKKMLRCCGRSNIYHCCFTDMKSLMFIFDYLSDGCQ